MKELTQSVIKDLQHDKDIFEDPNSDHKEHWKPTAKELEIYKQILNKEYQPMKWHLTSIIPLGLSILGIWQSFVLALKIYVLWHLLK